MGPSSLSLHHVIADDTHAVALLETTVKIGDRVNTGQYADVYLPARRHAGQAPTWRSTRRRGGFFAR
jgi:hypothetical protein